MGVGSYLLGGGMIYRIMFLGVGLAAMVSSAVAMDRPHIEVRPLVDCSPGQVPEQSPLAQGSCLGRELIVGGPDIVTARRNTSCISGNYVLDLYLSDTGTNRFYTYTFN